MPTPRIQKLGQLNNGEPTAVRVQSNVARALGSVASLLNDPRLLLEPTGTRLGILGPSAQVGLAGAQAYTQLDSQGNALLAMRDTPGNSATAFANANPGLQLFAKGGGTPLLDFGRQSGTTDWRIAQSTVTNDLTVAPYNGGVGKRFDVQAPVASSTGFREPFYFGYVYNSAGQVYSTTAPNDVQVNFSGGTVTRALKILVPTHTGSIVGVSAYLNGQAIPASQTFTVQYQRNGGAFSTLAAWTNANGSGVQPFTAIAKNTFPFTAGDVINLAVTSTYSCTANVSFHLTLELDPR